MSSHQRLLVTGAAGQLGRLVVEDLLRRVPPSDVSVLVRPHGDALPEAVLQLKQLGADVRTGDYDNPVSLRRAFDGVERLLLISSPTVGVRVVQHRNVIEAASGAGIRLIAYTSLLHADTSPLLLAEDHRQTEAALADAGMTAVILRNGWYTENHLGNIKAVLDSGVLHGSAGTGRIASASRADYAAAASAALLADDVERGCVLEVAGDNAHSLPDLAAEIARQSGKPVRYENMSVEAQEFALLSAGLPAEVARTVADADSQAARGALFDDGRTLSALIGRPTTSMAQSVRQALAAVGTRQLEHIA